MKLNSGFKEAICKLYLDKNHPTEFAKLSDSKNISSKYSFTRAVLIRNTNSGDCTSRNSSFYDLVN